MPDVSLKLSLQPKVKNATFLFSNTALSIIHYPLICSARKSIKKQPKNLLKIKGQLF
jgi:hypothetical protein